MKEASSAETPYGRYITSDGWLVLNLEDAPPVRNVEKGGASYPIEPREHRFENRRTRTRSSRRRRPDVGVARDA